MARVTPQQFAEKWARRTGQATQDYIAGVRGVREAPGQQAAEKADKLLAGVTRSINDGKWQARVSAVSLQAWQDAAVNKGAQRIAAGVQGAQSKMTRFASEVLPYLDNVVSEVKAMPDMTLEDRINRSSEFQRLMSQFRRS